MITIITDTGYCYGVKQALKILKKASREHPNVVLVHPLDP
jgi:4-hydroxy-3-methylbut-2-enyl diphosphate reductase IspH